MGTLWGGAGTQPTWKAPTLVGGKFGSQADLDAWKGAMAKGYQPGGAAPGMGNAYQGAATTPDQAKASTPQGVQDATDYRAATAWGLQNGFIKNTDSSGWMPGMSSGNDFLKTWGPIISVAGAGALAAAAPAAAAEEGAATTVGTTAAETAASQSLVPGFSASILPAATQSVVPGISSSILGGADAAAAASAAAAPEMTAGYNGGSTAGNSLGTPQAVDPIAAPASEAAPSISPGAAQPGSVGGTTGAGGTAPSTSLLTQVGDMLGHINTFSQGALAVGGLLGGLAGLQGGKSPGSPETPPAPPTPNAIDSQQGIKADVSTSMQPGGPLAGNASTWLTGASGVDPNSLNLGKSTLLGQ